MKSTELIALIEGPPGNLKKFFEDFDGKSNSINDWQKLLGYPLEPHSCQICHKIRNHIMSGLKYQYGVPHLSGAKYPALAKVEFSEAIKYIRQGEAIRESICRIYGEISKILYPN